MLSKKHSLDLAVVREWSSIQRLLTPTGKMLNEELMFKLRNSFFIGDLSQLPDKASRSDLQFLEVAWLFNQYRSLWHEIRYYEFLKFRSRWKESKTGFTSKRLDKAIEDENDNFQRYQLLSEAYYEFLNKYHPDSRVIAQHNAPAPDTFEADQQIQISEDENMNQMQSRGKRKRNTIKNSGSVRRQQKKATLDKSINLASQGSDETAELQSLGENVRLPLDEPTTLEMVPTELNDETQGEFHETKRYKCSEEVYKQTGIPQEHHHKSLNDFDIQDESGKSGKTHEEYNEWLNDNCVMDDCARGMRVSDKIVAGGLVIVQEDGSDFTEAVGPARTLSEEFLETLQHKSKRTKLVHEVCENEIQETGFSNDDLSNSPIVVSVGTPDLNLIPDQNDIAYSKKLYDTLGMNAPANDDLYGLNGEHGGFRMQEIPDLSQD